MARPRKTGTGRETDAAAFIGVRDMRDQVLYTQDGHAFAYVRIHPFSADLLSSQERSLFVQRITAEFSSEKKAFKVLSLSRPVDVSMLINEWSGIQAQTSNMYRRRLIQEEISATNEFALSGSVVERQFYIVVWEAEENAQEAVRRAQDMVMRFSQVGVSAEVCGKAEIIRLCNLFANPSSAHNEGLDIDATLPALGV